MTAPGHDLLVGCARGDLTLALSALQSADGCLRQLDLTQKDRVALVGQAIELQRMVDRLFLWVSVGTADLDAELDHLTDGL